VDLLVGELREVVVPDTGRVEIARPEDARELVDLSRKLRGNRFLCDRNRQHEPRWLLRANDRDCRAHRGTSRNASSTRTMVRPRSFGAGLLLR
jgi:hypothetical protein